MSETHTESYKPAPSLAHKRVSVWVWAIVLLVAIAALVAAVWWVGGIGPAEKLLGVENLTLPSFSLPFLGSSAPKPSPSAVPSAAASSPATGVVLPAQAQDLMFQSQVESQLPLHDLLDGKIQSLALGVSVPSTISVDVPVTATYTNRPKLKGSITLLNENGLWYFFHFRGADAGSDGPDAAMPTAFDSGIVSTITNQQAQPGTQAMIKDGIIGGGYREIQIDGVTRGERTATINVSLSGGSLPAATGRIVCVSKTDAGTTYWFVAGFEKR